MTPYKHTQIGTATLLALGIGVLTMGLIFFFVADIAPLSPIIIFVTLGLPGLILFLAALLFYNLTVEVDATELRFAFGIGLIRKNYPLSDIAACQPVRNRALYGWGIHLTPHGWLYNVSGLDAVEIEFGNRKKIRLGTDEPAQLARAIDNALGVKSTESD